VHGVFILSFWQFWFRFKAILPEEFGVNTLFGSLYYLSTQEFRGTLDQPEIFVYIDMLCYNIDCFQETVFLWIALVFMLDEVLSIGV
jgi:hypothetical protein